MSVRDLSEAVEPAVAVDADICVVGAGIAGLILATRLSRAGRNVVVVESGRRRQDPLVDAMNEVEDSLGRYGGSRDGRTRGLGGTSSLWGGRMLPLRPTDMEARPYVGLPAWPVSASDLAPYGPQIERLFGVDDLPFEADFLTALGQADPFPRGDADFDARWPKWASFRRCNLSVLLRAEIESASGPCIWIGATVAGFDLDEAGGRLRAVKAVGPGGRSLSVAAREFVLAAGTIESTRLLLWLREMSGGHAFAGNVPLGHYFQDHVSSTFGRLEVSNPAAVTRLFGFHFVGATRRNLHLETTPAAQIADRSASAFAQVVIEPSDASALETVKNLLRGLQRRRLELPLRRVARLPLQLPDLVRMAWWRYLGKRLYLSRNTALLVSIVAEQLPRHENRISLSERRDATGMPLSRLDWRLADADAHTFRSTVRRLGAYWTRAGFDRICPIAWDDRHDDGEHLLQARGLDIFHPSGTARMGLDRSDSVVDARLRCHEVGNLSVASAAVFPSAGSANPTYTLMQFAMRLADDLGSRLDRRS